MILTDCKSGCVAEDTSICMADGSEKPVKEIRIGDRIIGTDGRCSTVVDVMRGEEEQLFVIQAQGKKPIRVTAEHPMMTEQGWKMAGELTSEDRLLMEDGTLIPIQEYRWKDGNVLVYNLVLEGADAFIADGYVVGDFKRQMTCVQSKAGNV